MDGDLDEQWPRETFLADGLMRIEKKQLLPELRKWIKQQQSLQGEEEEEEEEEEEKKKKEDDDTQQQNDHAGAREQRGVRIPRWSIT